MVVSIGIDGFYSTLSVSLSVNRAGNIGFNHHSRDEVCSQSCRGMLEKGIGTGALERPLFVPGDSRMTLECHTLLNLRDPHTDWRMALGLLGGATVRQISSRKIRTAKTMELPNKKKGLPLQVVGFLLLEVYKPRLGALLKIIYAQVDVMFNDLQSPTIREYSSFQKWCSHIAGGEHCHERIELWARNQEMWVLVPPLLFDSWGTRVRSCICSEPQWFFLNL